MQQTRVQSQGREGSQEQETATHISPNLRLVHSDIPGPKTQYFNACHRALYTSSTQQERLSEHPLRRRSATCQKDRHALDMVPYMSKPGHTAFVPEQQPAPQLQKGLMKV